MYVAGWLVLSLHPAAIEWSFESVWSVSLYGAGACHVSPIIIHLLVRRAGPPASRDD